MLRILFLVLFLLCGLSAADTLPDAAQKIMAKATADIAKVRVALVRDLTKAQEVATKKGDLEGALAIKAEIERQVKEVDGAADLLGNPKDSNPFVGNWTVQGNRNEGTVIVLNKDGTGTWGGKINGSWNSSPDRSSFTVRWSNGVLYECTLKGAGVASYTDTRNGKIELTGTLTKDTK